MRLRKFLKITAILAVVSINVGCDQISKNLVRQSIDPHESITLVQDHVILTNVENSGAFLSLGTALPPAVKLVLLSVLPTLALAFGLFWLLRNADLNKMTLFGLSCIAGGGVGNLYDRLVHGSVTDFLYVHAGPFHTGIFNGADMSITFGVVFLLVAAIIPFHKFLPLKLRKN